MGCIVSDQVFVEEVQQPQIKSTRISQKDENSRYVPKPVLSRLPTSLSIYNETRDDDFQESKTPERKLSRNESIGQINENQRQTENAQLTQRDSDNTVAEVINTELVTNEVNTIVDEEGFSKQVENTVETNNAENDTRGSKDINQESGALDSQSIERTFEQNIDTEVNEKLDNKEIEDAHLENLSTHSANPNAENYGNVTKGPNANSNEDNVERSHLVPPPDKQDDENQSNHSADANAENIGNVAEGLDLKSNEDDGENSNFVSSSDKQDDENPSIHSVEGNAENSQTIAEATNNNEGSEDTLTPPSETQSEQIITEAADVKSNEDIEHEQVEGEKSNEPKEESQEIKEQDALVQENKAEAILDENLNKPEANANTSNNIENVMNPVDVNEKEESKSLENQEESYSDTNSELEKTLAKPLDTAL